MHAALVPKTVILLVAMSALVVGQTVGNGPGGEVTLSKCWGFPVVDSRTLSANTSHVFVGSDGAKVEALSFDGNKLWSSELGGETASNLLATDGGIFLVTTTADPESDKTNSGSLRYLSKETGITGWTVRLPAAKNYSLGLGGAAVIVVTSEGAILALDAATGSVKWRRELADGFVGEPRFNHANVYVATTSKSVITVSLDKGEIVSVQKVQFVPTAVSEITGAVFTGDERGNLTSLGKNERVKWNFRSGGKISAIVAAGNKLLVASNDNYVYLFTGRNGGIEWKWRSDDRVAQIGVVDNRFALVSAFEERGAHLIDLSSGKVAGQISFADGEFAIARPVSSGGKIFVLTNRAAYGYSATACHQ